MTTHTRPQTKLPELPTRGKPLPQTTARTPHVQLDQPAPVALAAELWEKMIKLPGVRTGKSAISAPDTRALHLDPSLAGGPKSAFFVGTEFCHLHGDGSGSMHIALPEARTAEIIARGWGEMHPAVTDFGLAPTISMVFGPRDQTELDLVWQLVEESYRYARGTESATPSFA